MRSLLAAIAMIGLLAPAAFAEAPPPPQAKPLSEILKTVESRPDFRYIDEAEWEHGSYYEIEYYTKEGAKVKIRVDPVSGAVMH